VNVAEVSSRLVDTSDGAASDSQLAAARTVTDRRCRNVRLFMLRLLLNQPATDMTLPWAQLLLPNVLRTTVHDLCMANGQSREGGMHLSLISEYNYFIRDVVLLICTAWAHAHPHAAAHNSVVEKQQCGADATTLISFLLRNIYHVNGDVMKENVLSVCSLLRRWCCYSTSPSAALIQHHPSYVTVCAGPLLSLLRVAAAPTGGAHATLASEGTRGVQCRLAALTVLRCLLLDCKYPLLSHQAHFGCCSNETCLSFSCGCSSNVAASIGQVAAAAAIVKEILDCVLECMRHARKEVMVSAARSAGIIIHMIHSSSSGIGPKKGVASWTHDCFPEFCLKFEGAVESIVFEILSMPKTVSYVIILAFQ
jgi:hypothetical protein